MKSTRRRHSSRWRRARGRTWSRPAGIVYTLDEHQVKITALSWRPDGQLPASAGEDGKFVLWDMKDGWPTRPATAHASPALSRYSKRTGILGHAFARDGRLVTTGRDHSLKLWNPDGTDAGSLADLKWLPTQTEFGFDGRLAFIGDFHGNLHVCDLETRKIVQTIGRR